MLKRQATTIAPSVVRVMRGRAVTAKKAEPGSKGIFDGRLPAEVIARYDAHQLYDILYGGTVDYWQNPVFIEMAKNEDAYIEELTSQINVEESIYICPSCGYDRIHVSQEQSRSGDESMTARYRCMRCGVQWSYSS